MKKTKPVPKLKLHTETIAALTKPAKDRAAYPTTTVMTKLNTCTCY
jgi:hypothetical protein